MYNYIGCEGSISLVRLDQKGKNRSKAIICVPVYIICQPIGVYLKSMIIKSIIVNIFL